MNEQRRQDYLNLINALLSCSSGEEPQILNANSDLVDAGLVETMVQVAEVLRDRGDHNAANFLINVAHRLAEALGLSSPTPTSSALPTFNSQLRFLFQVLQATLDSNGDRRQVVYQLLQANFDKLDDHFATVLRNWAMATLPKVESEQAQGMAVVLIEFSNLIQQFPLGNRPRNQDIAITGYEVATTVFTREAFPQDWAGTQNNLGFAYNERIRGERAENLEQAIRRYEAALELRTCEAFPYDWAMTQNNLGNAYRKRIRGKRAENLEKAIHCHKAALKIYTWEAFPEEWAMTQNNLGLAYSSSMQKKEENLASAICCYKAALKVYSCKTFPNKEKWAMTQNNLGLVYSDGIRKKAENLEKAIRCYEAALEGYICEDFPEQWAATKHNMGLAYLVRGERAENLEEAIQCFSDALQVRTRESFPHYHAQTQFSLGLAYQDARQFCNAYTAFATAIDTVESLRGGLVSGDEVKQKLAEEWNLLYQRMVEVCLELGYYDQAIEYAERSKTRNLVELIITRDLHSIFPSEIVSQLEHLRVEIANGQYQLQTATADKPTALAQHLQQLRQQRNELQDRYLPIGYGFNFEKFQETLDDYTAIIQWYITRSGFETFIITRYSLQRLILPTPANDLKALVDWANEYLDAYTQAKTHWINSLASRLSRLAEILHLEEILKLVPDTCSRLILIPHRYLHLFPLHALPLANGDFLCDRFPNGVGYAPSCQLLQLAQNREQHRHHFSRLLAIENPTRSNLSPLAGTKLQLEQICQHFDSDNSIVLREKEATEAALLKEQMRSPHCVHFCCHGSFNFGSPLKSALLHLAEPDSKLGADADLTLGKIFEKLNLEQCRLVTFSACETGIADPTSISDEYISLVSGFLYAGSPSVVSTLWAVQQAATNLFMIEFYKNLKQLLPLKPGSVAIALNKTQKWLRTLTGEELGKIIESPEFQRHLANVPENAENKLFKELLEAAKRKPFPYQNPYYWAAFVATGL